MLVLSLRVPRLPARRLTQRTCRFIDQCATFANYVHFSTAVALRDKPGNVTSSLGLLQPEKKHDRNQVGLVWATAASRELSLITHVIIASCNIPGD